MNRNEKKDRQQILSAKANFTRKSNEERLSEWESFYTAFKSAEAELEALRQRFNREQKRNLVSALTGMFKSYAMRTEATQINFDEEGEFTTTAVIQKGYETVTVTNSIETIVLTEDAEADRNVWRVFLLGNTTYHNERNGKVEEKTQELTKELFKFGLEELETIRKKFQEIFV